MKLLELLGDLNLPDWVTKNVVTALGKGIHGIITSATQIPIAAIENQTEKIKLIGEIKREIIKKASTHPLSEINTHPEIAKRVLENYGIKLFEEQINKEEIAQKTLNNLKNIVIPEIQPEISLSQDWLTAFWNLAATKSEEDIQLILSRILCNEIIQPCSLSLHTLQTISVLDSKVGNIFAKLCNMSFDDGRSAFFIHPNVFAFQNIGRTEDLDISFEDFLDLDGANLIRSAECIRINYSKPEDYVDGKFKYDNIEYAGKTAYIDFNGAQVNLIYFTQAGKELRKLIPLEENEIYTEKLTEIMKGRFKIKK